MSVQFTAAGQHYTSTASLPIGSYTHLSWVMISTDRNALTGFFNLDATTNGHYTGTEADGTTMRIDSAAGSFSGTSLTVGQWYRVAVTYNGTNGTAYYGLSGAALATVTGALSSGLTFAALGIGAGGPSFAYWLNGRIANYKQYSAVLTQAEIEVEFNSWNAVRTNNLVRHHRLQTPESADYSGNGNALSGGAGATAAADPPIPPPPRLPRVLRQAALFRAHYW